jgi:hypothetical protein
MVYAIVSKGLSIGLVCLEAIPNLVPNMTLARTLGSTTTTQYHIGFRVLGR